MNFNNYLKILSIISLLISIAYCKNQYVYTFDQQNFKVIDIENNKELVNQEFPLGNLQVQFQYIYKVTENNEKGSKYPIISLFGEQYITGLNFFTIDYNIDKNSFLNNGTEMPYTLNFDFYTKTANTPYTFINSNIYSPIMLSDGVNNNNSLLILNWDLENKNFKLFNYTENSSPIPYLCAMNMTSGLYYALLFGENFLPQIQVIDFSKGKSNGEKVALYKFSPMVFNFLAVDDIYVTSSGSLIAINLNKTAISICTIDLQSSSCKEVFSMEIGYYDNFFNLYSFDSTGDYMIISLGSSDHTKIIEYYYVKLSTFKIDFAFKTSNYFKTKPIFYYYT